MMSTKVKAFKEDMEYLAKPREKLVSFMTLKHFPLPDEADIPEVSSANLAAEGTESEFSNSVTSDATTERLVTSSEDDTSPVIMLWDLRNVCAPEKICTLVAVLKLCVSNFAHKILSGHEKVVLSISWCKKDTDLLLSCRKDNRSICWNPQSSEILGEVSTIFVESTFELRSITCSFPSLTTGLGKSSSIPQIPL
jgi:WD40 repeat protein